MPKYVLIKKATATSPSEEMLNVEFTTFDAIAPQIREVFSKHPELKDKDIAANIIEDKLIKDCHGRR